MKKLLYLIVYFLSPLPIILTLYSSNPVRYGNFSAMFSDGFGECGFYLVNLAVCNQFQTKVYRETFWDGSNVSISWMDGHICY